MTVRPGDIGDAGDTEPGRSPAGFAVTEDHGWLHEAEAERDAAGRDPGERTTKVRHAKAPKVRLATGAKRRR